MRDDCFNCLAKCEDHFSHLNLLRLSKFHASYCFLSITDKDVLYSTIYAHTRRDTPQPEYEKNLKMVIFFVKLPCSWKS